MKPPPEALKLLAFLDGTITAAHEHLGVLDGAEVEGIDQIRCGLEDVHTMIVELIVDETTGPEALSTAL